MNSQGLRKGWTVWIWRTELARKRKSVTKLVQRWMAAKVIGYLKLWREQTAALRLMEQEEAERRKEVLLRTKQIVQKWQRNTGLGGAFWKIKRAWQRAKMKDVLTGILRRMCNGKLSAGLVTWKLFVKKAREDEEAARAAAAREAAREAEKRAKVERLLKRLVALWEGDEQAVAAFKQARALGRWRRARLLLSLIHI